MSQTKAAGIVKTAVFFFLVVLAAAVFGRYGPKLYVVLSGSMEPTYPTGSVILTEPSPGSIGTQDVITYRTGQQTITHRVVRISSEGFITKGDNNPAEDPVPVQPEQVVGKVISCIPYAGYVVIFLRRPYFRFLLLSAAAFSALYHLCRIFRQKRKRGILNAEK